MSRRSTPQRDIDERAFPIRLKLRVPPTGLGNVLTDMLLWLAAGLVSYAMGGTT